jgi:hypothetical protein
VSLRNLFPIVHKILHRLTFLVSALIYRSVKFIGNIELNMKHDHQPDHLASRQISPTPTSDASHEIRIRQEEVCRMIYSMGFAGKEHIALALKLLANPPKEDFERAVLVLIQA